MSMDQAILHGKVKRKPYRGAKAIDPSCMRGDCPWCEKNKKYASRKREESAEDKLKDWEW
jgi:hypothetical protein